MGGREGGGGRGGENGAKGGRGKGRREWGEEGGGRSEGVLPSNRRPKYQSGRSMMIGRRGPRMGKGEQIQGEDRAHF